MTASSLSLASHFVHPLASSTAATFISCAEKLAEAFLSNP